MRVCWNGLRTNLISIILIVPFPFLLLFIIFCCEKIPWFFLGRILNFIHKIKKSIDSDKLTKFRSQTKCLFENQLLSD